MAPPGMTLNAVEDMDFNISLLFLNVDEFSGLSLAVGGSTDPNSHTF